MYGAVENLTVGDAYEIHCNVNTNKAINSTILNITWIGPNNESVMTDSRIDVTTISNGTNHISILLFSHLSEEDEGLYNCSVTVLLNKTANSDSFELKGSLSEFCMYMHTYINNFVNNIQHIAKHVMN